MKNKKIKKQHVINLSITDDKPEIDFNVLKEMETYYKKQNDKFIKLEKIEELPDAMHPNNISVGYIKTGKFCKEPVVGECFYIGFDYRTSPVTEIINECTFKTYNSIYKWTRM